MGKKLYITTAIPYVNAKPHIGNAIDYLLADIWARYQRQKGHDVRFQVGTDEHGNKIAIKAEAAGLDPKAYTDQMYVNFEDLMKKIGVTYTDFVRTTDAHHVMAVQYIWNKLKPYIYKGKYEGWYCLGHEAFFTDKEVQATGGICPDHQTPYQRVSEENYYFRTSAFSDQVRAAIESGRVDIVSESRKNEFLNIMKDGLHDVSISRPKKSLTWGIPVPDDPEQIMYVWIDALANYITVLGYPDNDTWQEYWPADVQVIGKDILRFHAGIWPAMLLGLGLSLPKRLLVHGHVNVSGVKMSKTIGNVVDPNEVIDNYSVDSFRYFFSRHIPTLDDGDFTWEKFESAYNNELGDDLGNLVQRITGMINRYQAGVIGEIPNVQHDMDAYHEYMKSLEFNRAIDEIWSDIRGLNQYLEDVKPWSVAKDIDNNPEAKDHLSEILSYSVASMLQISNLLYPFMPNTSKKIREIFETGVVTNSEILFPKKYLHTPDPRISKK